MLAILILAFSLSLRSGWSAGDLSGLVKSSRRLGTSPQESSPPLMATGWVVSAFATAERGVGRAA